jgi:mannosyl-oligosaccharide glucosidase
MNKVNLDRFPTISKDVKQMFADQFELVFMPKGPFREEDYTKFSHQLLSNLLGGIGYFYGDSKVDKSNNSAYLETGLDFWKSAANARSNTSPNFTEPLELFTGVPSRSFFPRGFLWDEGFHLMVVVDWDLDLAIEILQSWFNLMDDDGWIAREQILGPEARSKVPLQFQTQFPQFANPPTLFLIVETLVNILTGRERYLGTPSKWIANPKAANDLVVDLYTKLQKHYTWFRHTQSGNLTYSSLHRETSNVEGYRWRGRDMQHTLTSGLDDYPRALPPHPGELHVDAISWVGLMADVLGKVAAYLSRPSDVITYARDLIIIKRNAEIIHWSQEAKAFCDTTIKNKDISHVCHKGYMSLFPFLAGLLEPSNLQLEDILNLMGDEKELWSSYGLRSLSLKDPFYGKDENYWRGPIWININYLAIKALLVRI